MRKQWSRVTNSTFTTRENENRALLRASVSKTLDTDICIFMYQVRSQKLCGMRYYWPNQNQHNRYFIHLLLIFPIRCKQTALQSHSPTKPPPTPDEFPWVHASLSHIGNQMHPAFLRQLAFVPPQPPRILAIEKISVAHPQTKSALDKNNNPICWWTPMGAARTVALSIAI